MLRALIWILLLCGAALLIAPMVVASLYVDQRGVELTGHVYSKSEYVRMLRGTHAWSRESAVTFEYTLPETGGVSFFDVAMEPEKFDEFHKGQTVKLHYLRREDIPKLPGADVMWQIRLLPHVRLEGQHAFDGLRAAISPQLKLGFAAVAAIVILLWTWRRSKLPGFAWAMGVCIVCGIAVMMFYDFPRPTPAPVGDVRVASGKVKSIRRIDMLLSTSRSRGMPAHQPLDIVGIEFVPQGLRGPVLAVDLVDRGSVQGLAEGAPVELDYEAARPRTAWLRGGTRTFTRRNLIGLGEDAVLWIGVLIALVLLWQLIGKAFKRLLSRR
ncbi:MAG: hypothetical protein ABI806_19675 [Candidatus Solibacter sp.]